MTLTMQYMQYRSSSIYLGIGGVLENFFLCLTFLKRTKMANTNCLTSILTNVFHCISFTYSFPVPN